MDNASSERLLPFQPLYFENYEGFGQWRIHVTSRAEKHLREFRKQDGKMLRIILKKIKELSHGHFSDDNHKRLNGSPSNGVPVYEAKMTRDTRLVYQIDCMQDYDSESQVQVIKIFGVYTHAKLDKRLWDSMSIQLASKGDEYIKRCRVRRRLAKDETTFVPATFPEIEEPTQTTAAAPRIPQEDLDQIHSLLVLEKTYSLSKELINSVIAGVSLMLPFDMPPHEQRIVDHQGSCYVIGRSGTGKTTTMVFKMLKVERNFYIRNEFYGDVEKKPRQMFVTRSKALADKVAEFFYRRYVSLETATKSREEMEQLARAESILAKTHTQGPLVDKEEEERLNSTVPEKFSLLEDSHFPLFITYDQLCTMIEGDLREDRPRLSKLLSYSGPALDYKKFRDFYWGGFPETLTKHLDPYLVYSEFIGVIKGGEGVLDPHEPYLDRQSYMNLSHRTNSTFYPQRALIYELFGLFLRRKRLAGHYDPADRTRNILKALTTENKTRFPYGTVDYLYIDEAQDNLMIEALLLRLLCRNPNGLFIAGDTAQTISEGSSFRFDDLKSMLFKAEKEMFEEETGILWSSPHLFQLAVNYRSHGGIVNAAHTVVDVITRLFPYSIDTLDPETSVVNGVRPVFYHGADQEAVQYEQIFFGDGECSIDFGANQCIIVRNEEALKRFTQQSNSHGEQHGIVLTIYDTKGQEYNDVLLYNFFQDSTVDQAQWRVVLNAVPPNYFSSMTHKPPELDEIYHAAICSELKQLYVAVTRARKNLWIVDNSDRAIPMLELWLANDQVDHRTPDTVVEDILTYANYSTPEEWGERARKLFDLRQYFQALHCFTKAGLIREKSICYAYYSREEAEKEYSRSGGNAFLRFITAAEAFKNCATSSATEGELASFLRNSATCFELAHEYCQAAELFMTLRHFAKAAQLYRKQEMFDKAVEIIQAHKPRITDDVFNEVIDAARSHHLLAGRFQHALKIQLFPSTGAGLQWLQSQSMDRVQIRWLEEDANFFAAAEVHISKGRLLEAIPTFLKERTNPSAVRRATQCALASLWESFSLGATVNAFARKNVLIIDHLEEIDVNMLDQEQKIELRLFRGMVHASQDKDSLECLWRAFLDSGDIAPALLCLDHYLTHLSNLTSVSASKIFKSTDTLLLYAEVMHTTSLKANLCRLPSFQKLFGFYYIGPTRVAIPPGSLLFNYKRSSLTLGNANDALSYFDYDIIPDLGPVLIRRIHACASEHFNKCLMTQELNPCLEFELAQTCMSAPQPCNKGHFERSVEPAISVPHYSTRIRLCLKQLTVLEALRPYGNWPEYLRWTSVWTSQMYDAIFPAHPTLGVAPSHIRFFKDFPEFNDGIKPLNSFCPKIIHFMIPPDYTSKGVLWPLESYMKAITLAVMFNRFNASKLVSQAPLAAPILPRPDPLVRVDGVFILEGLYKSYGIQKDAISHGNLLLRHVVQERLTIDIRVLCDYLERQVTLSVASDRYILVSSLTGITLPEGWLQRLLLFYTPEHIGGMGTIAMSALVMATIGLLYDVCDGVSDYLTFDAKRLRTLPSPLRVAFIMRICRALVLLGYNLSEDHPVQQYVLYCLSSIDCWNLRMHESVRNILVRYLSVHDLSDVKRLVERMPKDFPSDPLARVQGDRIVPFVVHVLRNEKHTSRSTPITSPTDGVASGKPDLACPSRVQTPPRGTSILDYYLAYRQALQKTPFFFTNHFYRDVVLSSLPHIMIAIDDLSASVKSLREKLQVRVNSSDTLPHELPGLRNRLAHETDMLKGIEECRIALAPGSNSHKEGSMDTIRICVNRIGTQLWGTEKCPTGREHLLQALRRCLILAPK